MVFAGGQEIPDSFLQLVLVRFSLFVLCSFGCVCHWGRTIKHTPTCSNLGDLRITSASTERQKRSQNVAPVLVIISGNSLVFSRKIITSIGFYRCCAAGASAPVVVKNQSPIVQKTFPGRARVKFTQNEGHEKATKKQRKTPKHCFSKQMRATKKPRKSNEQKRHK